jgi:hypothetical protein
MKLMIGLITLVLSLSATSWAQGESEDPESKNEAVPAPADMQEGAPTTSDPNADMAKVLSDWEKGQGVPKTTLPRRWLFLQEQAGAYGAPSPLEIDKLAFEGYGWFQLAEIDSIRLFLQLNPAQRKEALKPEDLLTRLSRYAELSRADGILMRTAGENASWALYRYSKPMNTPVVNFVKGPESFRNDAPAAWLVSQLNYDAMVVGTQGDYLVLAKLRPLKRGSQGLILKKSAGPIVADAEKDVGALLRIVFDSDDYALAKVSLAKSGRPKVPIGSKILFDQP